MAIRNLTVGDILVNNDPRNKGQEVTVRAVIRNGSTSGIAKYQTEKRWVSIKFARIFSDGKSRAAGYNTKTVAFQAPVSDPA